MLNDTEPGWRIAAPGGPQGGGRARDTRRTHEGEMPSRLPNMNLY